MELVTDENEERLTEIFSQPGLDLFGGYPVIIDRSVPGLLIVMERHNETHDNNLHVYLAKDVAAFLDVYDRVEREGTMDEDDAPRWWEIPAADSYPAEQVVAAINAAA